MRNKDLRALLHKLYNEANTFNKVKMNDYRELRFDNNRGLQGFIHLVFTNEIKEFKYFAQIQRFLIANLPLPATVINKEAKALKKAFEEFKDRENRGLIRHFGPEKKAKYFEQRDNEAKERAKAIKEFKEKTVLKLMNRITQYLRAKKLAKGNLDNRVIREFIYAVFNAHNITVLKMTEEIRTIILDIERAFPVEFTDAFQVNPELLKLLRAKDEVRIRIPRELYILGFAELELVKEYFGVDIHEFKAKFTKDDFRKKRRELLAKYHPDNKDTGNELRYIIINKEFEILETELFR
jgi:hypothetical protein